MPEGAHAISFGYLAQAVRWAKDHGGWICAGQGRTEWFDASVWTPTKIIDATRHWPGRTRSIGTWPMFEGEW